MIAAPLNPRQQSRPTSNAASGNLRPERLRLVVGRRISSTARTTFLPVSAHNVLLISNRVLNAQLFQVFPLIFHSINDEIPQDSRPLITRIFQLWLVLCVTLIINMVACIFILTSGGTDGGKDLAASIRCAAHLQTRPVLTLC